MIANSPKFIFVNPEKASGFPNILISPFPSSFQALLNLFENDMFSQILKLLFLAAIFDRPLNYIPKHNSSSASHKNDHQNATTSFHEGNALKGSREGRPSKTKADDFNFVVLLWEVAIQQQPDDKSEEYGSSFRGPLLFFLETLMQAGCFHRHDSEVW
eukprot:gene10929-3003_t